MVIEQPNTSASNGARGVAEGRSTANAEWEANKDSKIFSSRLKGKTGTKRPVLMTLAKSLASRFFQLECGHAPTAVYLKLFGHQVDDTCWSWAGTAAQTREHLFSHCSRWRIQQNALRRAGREMTGWKVDRCCHMQASGIFSGEECDQAVVDFRAFTGVEKFPPKRKVIRSLRSC